MCSGPQDSDFLVDKGKSVKIFFDLWSDKQQKKATTKEFLVALTIFTTFFAGFLFLFSNKHITQILHTFQKKGDFREKRHKINDF